jgi:hypothetical protein
MNNNNNNNNNNNDHNNSHGRVNASTIDRNGDNPSTLMTITVVGNRCLADPAIEDQDLFSKSLHLARLAGVDLLSIKYVQNSPDGKYFFASAEPCPSILPGAPIEKAVLDYFRERMMIRY